MTSWKPISTIPKNGTWVLVWDSYYKKVDIARAGTDGVPQTGDWDYSINEATHWQPLPSPPEQQQEPA